MEAHTNNFYGGKWDEVHKKWWKKYNDEAADLARKSKLAWKPKGPPAPATNCKAAAQQ